MENSDGSLGGWLREHTFSPMTTWLSADRHRRMACALHGEGGMVVTLLLEASSNTWTFLTGARGSTVEEAMAHALNALMATEEPPLSSSQSGEPPESSA